MHTAGDLFPSHSCIDVTRVKPPRDSNLGPKHERWMTYQLSYPSILLLIDFEKPLTLCDGITYLIYFNFGDIVVIVIVIANVIFIVIVIFMMIMMVVITTITIIGIII